MLGLILTRIAIGVLMLGVAALILGVGLKLIKENSKKDNQEQK
jgi:hypothetical protein